MSVTITSFGFKYGLPMEADLVFDVRCHAEPLLHRRSCGTRRVWISAVADYVFSFRQTQDFMEQLGGPAGLLPARCTPRRARPSWSSRWAAPAAATVP